MPTPSIFDFDPERLADYDEDRVAEALEDYPALYVNHLHIAQHIQGWAERVESGQSGHGDPTFNKGYVQALREVAAHLRQCDYLPTGTVARDARTMRERSRTMRD